MRITKRPVRQARAIPVRRVRHVPRPRLSRAPIAAVLLSLLALLAPELTLAPLQAVEPRLGPRPIDVAEVAVVPRVSVDEDLRVAGPVPPTPVVVADAPRYQAALDEARYYGLAYGVTFAAVRDGQLLWAGSSGVARDGRTDLVPDSPLVIGSVTKTFVAAAILELAEEGRISLDDPARTHLPGVRILDPAITVRQLLDHTSGLADVFNERTRTGIEEHPDHAWTIDEVLGTLDGRWGLPGQGWAYANTNYLVLGLIVERITGSSLADELQRRFLGPLDLPSTHLLPPGDASGPLAPAWTTIFYGSGAMVSSAADLARWGDALYGDDLLRDATRAQMLDVNDHDYGLGAQRIELPDAVGYGHTGLLNTYTTLLWHLPSEEVTVALLVNRSHVDLVGMLLAEPPGGKSLFELATGLDSSPLPALPPQEMPEDSE